MSVLFSVTFPERTTSLILIGSYGRLKPAPDYPWGRSLAELEGFLDGIEREWGGPLGLSQRAPSVANDKRFQQWWGKYSRLGASPSAATALAKMNYEIDIRRLLPSVRVPTLVLHAKGDRAIPVESGRYMAEHIPGATFVELDSEDHIPWVGCPEEILKQVEEFITGSRGAREVDRVVKTVMFTDIVDSTGLAAEMGDSRWRDVLRTHHDSVRRELSIYRGQEVKTTGDGFHAVFDGPGRAVQCACAVRDALNEIGIAVRIGLHTGECEVVGDELEGLAIHIGARVSAAAEENEVLVSQTVKDLVAGATIQFKERGVHLLKGVPGEWHLYRVE